MLNCLTRNKLFHVKKWASDSNDPDGVNSQLEEVTALEDADVVTSELKGNMGLHTPVLDIDIPCELIESSTPGHHHLFFDTVVDGQTYERLLDALADAGIIERGYANVSKVKGFTAVRLPWKKKLPSRVNPALAFSVDESIAELKDCGPEGCL